MPVILDHHAAFADLRDHLAAIPLEHLPDDAREHVAAALRAAEHFTDVGEALSKVRHDPTISVDDYAELLGINRGTAYEAVKNGDVPSVSVGRRIRVPSAPVRRLLGIDESGVA